jgi:hypothetical protein
MATYANVVATLALVLAIGGGAAIAVRSDRVRSDDIARNQVKSSHIGPNQVKSSDIASSAVGMSEMKPLAIASAHPSRAMSIPGNTSSAGDQIPFVEFDTLDYNTGQGEVSYRSPNPYDLQPQPFIVNRDGIYSLHAQVTWQPSAASERAAYISVNRDGVIGDGGPTAPSGFTVQSVSGLYALQRGDKIGLMVFSSGSRSPQSIVPGAAATRLSVAWVADCPWGKCGTGPAPNCPSPPRPCPGAKSTARPTAE